MINNTIGEKIKQYRKSINMSRNELANKIGCSVHAIAKYEQNQRIPSLDMIRKIATALSIAINKLIVEENDLDTLTNNNINLKVFDKKLDLVIHILENYGYDIKTDYKKKFEITDNADTIKPINLNFSDFKNFSKNLNWVINGLVENFIQENSNGLIEDEDEEY
ncbi:TPA: helix-turn-helix domain-containing protein [Clostridioides difficile]